MSQDTQPIPDPTIFDTVLDVYRTEAFNGGYHRATNDLLADFALVAKEFLREQTLNNEDLRQALRLFQQRFEQHLEQAASTSKPTEQYVTDGLGI